MTTDYTTLKPGRRVPGSSFKTVKCRCCGRIGLRWWTPDHEREQVVHVETEINGRVIDSDECHYSRTGL